jgi:hypothetical protein
LHRRAAPAVPGLTTSPEHAPQHGRAGVAWVDSPGCAAYPFKAFYPCYPPSSPLNSRCHECDPCGERSFPSVSSACRAENGRFLARAPR